ncbi:MAG: molybdopterin-dependent oxidoreductase [Gammaproteobacteria bacterium]|nr:molybdopterin-dependent oxidoreductase [Gammaproteobacteria bacterium]MDH5801585.1 molybdopterin-dependent oxidoreductase [Gammaproteobacteria bacterium]
MNTLEQFRLTRRRFLQVSGTVGLTGASAMGLGTLPGFSALSHAEVAAPKSNRQGDTVVTKNVCHQCPARCGIDVYTTNGRVHAIYGALDHPISNGKLCPKGHLGAYILYDPDRFKGPMKRSNPKKGRNEDPRFVPISWDEALDIFAARLQALRDRGESHRFSIFYGRGWGESDAGMQKPFAKLYGTPNIIGHSSMCADAGKKVKLATDGNYSYSAYDYANTNYLLNFGAGFLDAFRPYNGNMQAWGKMRSKSPKTRVTVVEVHLNATGAAADQLLLVKPGTDGALALAIAHVILAEGLWDKEFVGDFKDKVNRFRPGGVPVDPSTFESVWVKGLVEWWNQEVKDRTPAWAEKITSVPENDITTVAREFGTTRPAMALFERGPTSHSNGTYNGMAIHALNALTGSLFAKGGLFYQIGPSYGKPPADYKDYQDDYAASEDRKQHPRIDKVGTDEWPMAKNMMQEVAKNHLAGNPYKLDTAIFYLTNPTFTSPDPRVWEEALKEIFVIDTSPFPSETAMMADLILPDHTYLERLQDTPTYPYQGYPLANLRVPAVKPLYNTMLYSDVLMEVGKRLKGGIAEYYEKTKNTENVLRHIAKGFEQDPGDNGVNGFESWKEKGVWYKKPYLWRQQRGKFYEWDGGGYNRLMTAEQVKQKLIKTPSGKFEFKSAYLEKHAEFINRKLGIQEDRVGFPQWIEPRHTGGGDLHLITPKVAMHAEGRGSNLPHAINLLQPSLGGNKTVFLEIHPKTARSRGIRNHDKVRIKSSVGTIDAYARYFEGTRPDTVVLPMEHGHWAMGRWAKNRMPGHSGEVTENVSDPISGLAGYYTGKVTVQRI